MSVVAFEPRPRRLRTSRHVAEVDILNQTDSGIVQVEYDPEDQVSNEHGSELSSLMRLRGPDGSSRPSPRPGRV